MYCCLTREPSFVSMLKLTLAELSVAEKSFTGMDTRPKLRVSEARERAAMRISLTRRVGLLEEARTLGRNASIVGNPRSHLAVMATAPVCVVCAMMREWHLLHAGVGAIPLRSPSCPVPACDASSSRSRRSASPLHGQAGLPGHV